MQKPLKQFTKCSSLTTFFIVFVITFSLSSTALTTFGIGKPQSNPPLATTAPKGRECSSNADCLGIAETSCVKDFDYQLRCLCGDYLAPQNGLCKTRVKGLHHQCRLSEDCEDNMICREQNNTKFTEQIRCAH
ncbi:hypothetical protein PVAND_008666 [Polypedilum vanderplanki]|uniref:EGF-like domain-containing protein n=1 Tax=Polypedilum vanderplanki TaxID=319348 RepID=A0A9J6CAY4_POLVA|nr:hypothetical protein PVAND_008666 [Polypedilum vanderplanki]